MGSEKTTRLDSEWKTTRVRTRSVMCHRPECDYMAEERVDLRMPHLGTGVCTKCGKWWQVSPEDAALALQVDTP